MFTQFLAMHGRPLYACSRALRRAAPAVWKAHSSPLLPLSQAARSMYISPPIHGAAIATAILGDTELRAQWRVRLMHAGEGWQGPPCAGLSCCLCQACCVSCCLCQACCLSCCLCQTCCLSCCLCQRLLPAISRAPRLASFLIVGLQRDLQHMADAMAERRHALHDALVRVGAPGCWRHIAAQRGMFSFTGLTRVSRPHKLPVLSEALSCVSQQPRCVCACRPNYPESGVGASLRRPAPASHCCPVSVSMAIAGPVPAPDRQVPHLPLTRWPHLTGRPAG